MGFFSFFGIESQKAPQEVSLTSKIEQDESENASSLVSSSSSSPHSIGITFRKSKSTSNSSSIESLPTSKSLTDLETLDFLYKIDQLLHDQVPLSKSDLDRLETLAAQGHIDDCQYLLDIVEHYETEHRKVMAKVHGSSSSLCHTIMA